MHPPSGTFQHELDQRIKLTAAQRGQDPISLHHHRPEPRIPGPPLRAAAGEARRLRVQPLRQAAVLGRGEPEGHAEEDHPGSHVRGFRRE